MREAWDNKDSFHPSGQFLWFEKSCPWKEHLYKIERDLDLKEQIKFAFMKDGRGMFRIQAVSKSSSSFENRVSICAAYRGLRGEELCAASGLKDCEFVHAAGFVGGAWSLESVVKMAEQSMEEYMKIENLGKELEKK